MEPLSKILEFRMFQISHAAKTNISKMHEISVVPIMCSTLSLILIDTSHWMPSLLQQAMAKRTGKEKMIQVLLIICGT